MNKKRTIILMLFTLLFCFIQAGADTGSVGGDMDVSFLPEDNDFSMNMADADVKNIFKIIGEGYGINFLVNQSVTGTMTVNFKKVPIRDAFTSILKNFELNFTRDGSIVRIDKFASLERKKENAPLITRAINVKYTFDSFSAKSGTGRGSGSSRSAGQSLTKLAESLRKMLSGKEGSDVSVIRRSNTLLVTDIVEVVNKIEKLIRNLDKKSKQIKIMARIIEATTDFTRQLGISWGGAVDGTFEMNSKTKNVQARGAQTAVSNLSDVRFAQNASNATFITPTAGLAVDFLLGKVSSNFLDLQLAAMENDGHGKVLDSPKVITQNNMAAMIKSGLKVPVRTVEEGTVTVKYEDALLKMETLPHIIDGDIFLDLKIIKDEVDEIRERIDGNPFILKKEITTKVLVKDGETVVIGGLITQKEADTMKGIPYLSKIPLLGWLFRFEQNINNKTELLIFVTPTILKR